MKVKNFPGHKNQRRISALERIKQRAEAGFQYGGMTQDIKNLESKVLSPQAAMAIETKKFQPRPRKKVK